jgi:hypothetical protein
MLREFTDRNGESWQVWDVRPSLHADDERESTKRFATVPVGWLCFESRSDRRRLSPIPQDWHLLDASALDALRAKAKSVPAVGRDIDAGASPI